MRGQFTNPFGTWNTPVSLRDGKILMSIDFARREWEGMRRNGKLRLCAAPAGAHALQK